MHKIVFLVAGPTAVGKTNLAIQLAKYFNTQIISADSRQCFKEISIAVAKPTTNELQEVKHHFINSHSVHETVNAGTFEQYALGVVAELFKKHNTVVMVGGTGLYIKAFCEGMDDIPLVDEALRKQLQDNYQHWGMAWLQEKLQMHDPLFSTQGEMQNPQRMLRALELVLTTGQSILQYRKGMKQPRSFNIIKIGLELPREKLYQCINHRVDTMIQGGLLEEAKNLYPLRYLNALQTVGYRELFDYFDENMSMETAVEKIKQNTRHYAKRQLTWFKKDPEMKWFHPSQQQEMIDYCLEQIKKPELL